MESKDNYFFMANDKINDMVILNLGHQAESNAVLACQDRSDSDCSHTAAHPHVTATARRCANGASLCHTVLYIMRLGQCGSTTRVKKSKYFGATALAARRRRCIRVLQGGDLFYETAIDGAAGVIEHFSTKIDKSANGAFKELAYGT